MNALRRPDLAISSSRAGFLRWLPLALAASLVMTVTACRNTRFPDHPQEHRLARQLAAAPHPYYELLANGVFSRLAGRLPADLTPSWLRQIKEEHWKRLAPLSSQAAIVAYLREHGLAEVADTIVTAGDALARQRPPEADAKLEAAAILQGLIEAYYGFFPPAPPR